MKKFVLDDDLSRMIVFVALGAVYFIVMLRFPTIRTSGFLVSFFISLLAGFASLKFQDTIVTAVQFVLGTVLGLSLNVALYWLVGTGLAENAMLMIKMMVKAALVVDLVGMLPWIVGVPIGFWLRRKLS